MFLSNASTDIWWFIFGTHYSHRTGPKLFKEEKGCQTENYGGKNFSMWIIHRIRLWALRCPFTAWLPASECFHPHCCFISSIKEPPYGVRSTHCFITLRCQHRPLIVTSAVLLWILTVAVSVEVCTSSGWWKWHLLLVWRGWWALPFGKAIRRTLRVWPSRVCMQ